MNRLPSSPGSQVLVDQMNPSLQAVRLLEQLNCKADKIIANAPRPEQTTQAQDGLKEVIVELRRTNELLLTIVIQILYRGCPEPEAAEAFLTDLESRLKDVSASSLLQGIVPQE